MYSIVPKPRKILVIKLIDILLISEAGPSRTHRPNEKKQDFRLLWFVTQLDPAPQFRIILILDDSEADSRAKMGKQNGGSGRAIFNREMQNKQRNGVVPQLRESFRNTRGCTADQDAKKALHEAKSSQVYCK